MILVLFWILIIITVLSGILTINGMINAPKPEARFGFFIGFLYHIAIFVYMVFLSVPK